MQIFGKENGTKSRYTLLEQKLLFDAVQLFNDRMDDATMHNIYYHAWLLTC